MAIIPTSGEFTKVPEGGGVTVVTFENSLNSPDVFTPNMTREEMYDAAPNGIIGVCVRHSTRGSSYFQMYPEGYPGAVSDFYRVRPISKGIRAERLVYNLDTEKWDFSYVDYSLTPST